MTPILKARIVKTHLYFVDVPKYIEYISRFKPDQILDVIIRKPSRNRTLSQNNYLWGVCYKIIGDELGYDVEEIHEIMKQRFLKRQKDITFKGKNITLEKTLSTTKLSTAQFNQYVDKVKMFASSELGIYIPDPNEINLDDYAN